MKPTLEIYDSNDIQYRPAVRGLKFSRIWQGGEDLMLSFILDRSSAHDWPDVGYDYEVVLRNGLAALWRGRVRRIDQEADTIGITALGNCIYLDDYPYSGGGSYPGTKGRLWVDTRLEKWKVMTPEETGFGSYWPERAQIDTQDRLFLAPRKNENFGNSPWIYFGLFYRCLYDDIKRVTFNYNFTDPDDWEARLISYDATWGAGATEWSLAATAAAAADVTLATARPIITFSMRDNSANADFAGETGSCKLKITNLKIYGTTSVTIHANRVTDDIVSQLQAGTPIENDESLIENITLTLEPLFYEDGETCLDALDDTAGYGDTNNRVLAWGVESGAARIFLRAPDRDKVRYVVPMEHCRKLLARGETFRDYYSAAIGRYTDEEGAIRYTDEYYAHVTTTGIVANTTSTGDDLASTIYGVTREDIPNFGRVSSTLATEFIKQFIIDHGHPRVASSFEVIGQVQDLDRGGVWIEPYEVETGYLVQVPHFRAVEAEGASGVDLREWDTTFILAGMEWDDESQVARLIPETAVEDLRGLIRLFQTLRQRGRVSDHRKRVGRHYTRRQIDT